MIRKKDIVILAIIFIMGFSLRLGFAPRENMACDSFEILSSAKTLAETGRYMITEVGLSDLVVHYSYAGWPVGYALMLSILFKVFGYSELIATYFTVFISSLVIILTAITAALFWDRKTGYIAGLVVAINPLLVAFNGRIFTNNPELLFLMLAFTCLFISVVRKGENLEFVDLQVVIGDRWRLTALFISFLFFGFLLTVRDTASVFFLVYVYVFIKCGFLNMFRHKRGLWIATKLCVGMAAVFLVGYLPSLYFNYQNYGTVLTSTHAQWGGRLDFNLFLFGDGAQVALPGSLIMVITALVYCFPLVTLLLLDRYTKKDKFFLAIIVLMFVPILFINGSYFTASSGASPRYMLPLMPFVSVIVARCLIYFFHTKFSVIATVLVLSVICWQILLTYPPPFMFKISPKFAYAAQYSPVYQVYPYENYPLHSNAMAKWVRDNTPKDSVIITHSRTYHYYYLANRDVVFLSKVTIEALSKYIETRPVFYVDDHEATYNSDIMNQMKGLASNGGFELLKVGEVKLFSPVVGHTQMKAYRILRLRPNNG